MPCPTCDHTMERVVGDVTWCPRCGTIQVDDADVGVPKLVQRCRRFAREPMTPEQAAAWHRIGLTESINTPENR